MYAYREESGNDQCHCVIQKSSLLCQQLYEKPIPPETCILLSESEAMDDPPLGECQNSTLFVSIIISPQRMGYKTLYVRNDATSTDTRPLTKLAVVFLVRGQLVECLEYIYDVFLPDLESIMVGVGNTHPVSTAIGEKPTIIDAGSVAEELKTFGKECKHIHWSSSS